MLKVYIFSSEALLPSSPRPSALSGHGSLGCCSVDHMRSTPIASSLCVLHLHGNGTGLLTVSRKDPLLLSWGCTWVPLGACMLDSSLKETAHGQCCRNVCQPDQGLPTDFRSRTLRLSHREGPHPYWLDLPRTSSECAMSWAGSWLSRIGFCDFPSFDYGHSVHQAASWTEHWHHHRLSHHGADPMPHGVPQPSLSSRDAGLPVAGNICVNGWLKKPRRLPHYTLLLRLPISAFHLITTYLGRARTFKVCSFNKILLQS